MAKIICMKFHLLGLATYPISKEINHVAFIPLAANLCKMIKKAGHQLIVYAPYGSEVVCDEFVEVASKEDLDNYNSLPQSIRNYEYSIELEIWKKFNKLCEEQLQKRYNQGDIVLLASSPTLYPFIKNYLYVEALCGYEGVGENNRVFPSNAWMHYILGKKNQLPKWFDRVIPHFLDKEDFSFCPQPKDYYLFLGRLNLDKGLALAVDICRKNNKKLVVAGKGLVGANLGLLDGENLHFFGLANREERLHLMSKAKALIAPTFYTEPFGMVLIEANACGTPVITTDWGAFPEIVQNGVNGYRCNLERDFVKALDDVNSIDRAQCRKHFEQNYSLDVIWPKFSKYFRDVSELNREGWYAK